MLERVFTTLVKFIFETLCASFILYMKILVFYTMFLE